MSNITQKTLLAQITNYPSHPIAMFKSLLNRLQRKVTPMNLATIDKEFGVLNRTVMYRGLIDDLHIYFTAERTSRKYQNIKENPKVAVTMLEELKDNKNSDGIVLPEIWQIRLLDAEAMELNEQQVQRLWQNEPLYARIRSHLYEGGRPKFHLELKTRYLALMQRCQNGELPQTKAYTGLKIITKCWEFYKSEPEKISDIIRYNLKENNKWQVANGVA